MKASNKSAAARTISLFDAKQIAPTLEDNPYESFVCQKAKKVTFGTPASTHLSETIFDGDVTLCGVKIKHDMPENPRRDHMKICSTCLIEAGKSRSEVVR